MSHRTKEEHGKQLKRNCRESEIDGDGEAWLLDDSHKMETS
jgi:hypothetical protein